MRNWRHVVFLVFVASLALAPPAFARPPSLIPWPAQVTQGEGEFLLDGDSAIRVARGDRDAEAAARAFAQLLQRTRGIALKVDGGKTTARDIVFATDLAEPKANEAYAIDVTPEGVRVRAHRAAGLYYGGVTLWQLLTSDARRELPLRVASVRINDAPRFAWRGVMLDTVRHFRTVGEIEQFLDWMALHKLNVFHWHLTDDQGWRLQIRRYPKLTEVGAWRTNPDGSRHGGFYTQDEARAIVAYAAARHIVVVPEIEMPGHAQAALAAHPELAVDGAKASVANGWGVSPFVFDTEEQTFVFLQNVLDEVMDVFPGSFVHIGGDEAEHHQWTNSPRERALMRERGLADSHALQSWFVGRIGRYLREHGRRMIGWDEVLEGGDLPEGAAVMAWRGWLPTSRAATAAQRGHDAVVTHGTPLYFDQRQSDAADEPPGQPALNDLRKVYMFDPVPPGLTAEQGAHLLGVQANLWSEYLRTFEQVQWQAFPRMAALAEMAWTPHAARDWSSFLARLPAQMERYRQTGVHAADSAFAVRIEAIADGEVARVTLRNQVDFGELRYTLDGTEPTARSPLYREPLRIPMPTTVKAATFSGGAALSATRTLRVDAAALRTRRNEQLAYCNGEDGIRLEDDTPTDGVRAVLPTQLGGVCLAWKQAPLDGIGAIRVQVGNVANRFMYGKDEDVLPKPAPSPERGELRVYRDGCDKGELLAALPLAPARVDAGLSTLTAALRAGSGVHDLCLRIEGAAPDLTWAVSEVELVPATAP